MPREQAGKSTKAAAGRVSLAAKDAVESGLFTSGKATIKESVFADFKYPTGEKAQVWLLTFTREGEAPYEQPYGLGKGWKIGNGGELVPLAGQTGLPKSCNAMKHLIASLERCGVGTDLLESGDPSFLEGAEVVVLRVPQEERKGLTDKPRRDGKERNKDRTILEIEDILVAPWDKKFKGKGGAKAKPAVEDEDTDDADDDDDEAEAPVESKGKNGKAKPAPADDDDDADEPPAKSAKGKSKPNGKAPADDADDDTDNLIELGVEALIQALEETSPLKLADAEQAVRDQLKGNKQAKAIAAAICDPDELDKEKGWTFDGKRIKLA